MIGDCSLATTARLHELVRLTTTPGLKVPVYPAGWRAHLLGRDAESGGAAWFIADLDRVDVLLVIGRADRCTCAAFSLAGYEFVGTSANQSVWARLSSRST